MGQWSRDFSSCKVCGTNTVKHIAKGLCCNCYTREINQSNRGSKSQSLKINAKDILTKEYLECEYIAKNKSLGDIAKECFCSRQYVYYRLRDFGIKTRNKTDARTLALNSGKVIFDENNNKGNEARILKKIHIKEDFFSVWSAKMAYVLGVIFTDGNIDPGNKLDITRKTRVKIPRLSIVQKEPELLEKVKKLMDCDATLYYRKEKIYNGIKSGASFSLSISNYSLFKDLSKIGLTPDKSLNMKFPNIPGEYLRHFIRGCWDGDGSVFLSTQGYICASYVCGSKAFIEKLADKLNEVGITKGKINEQKAKNISYKVRYSGDNCHKLYKYLYEDVEECMYLQRKYDVFENYYNDEKRK